jgi:methyl-accepting chemotaxis protein
VEELGMSIVKKLYFNFAAILVIMGAMFAVNFYALHVAQESRSASRAATESLMTSAAVRQQMMQIRQDLRTFLLSGRDADLEKFQVESGKLWGLLKEMQGKFPGQQAEAIDRVGDSEAAWTKNFAEPLIAKRREVAANHGTLTDMRDLFVELRDNKMAGDSLPLLNQAEEYARRQLDESVKADNAYSGFALWASVGALLIVLVLGVLISYYTGKKITDPLQQLIEVTHDIGESGDLDHDIDISREDEIGALARSFSGMVSYLKEMSTISEAIAGGDLSNEVEPHSKRDVLGQAFARMTVGLGSLVRSVRDSAAQVASGSGQVANASEESAKVSVQAASAIEEVTSTMHEMSINVQNMVRSTQMQATSVSDTSSSIDEMVASIQRVADTSKVLLDISNRSRQEVQNGIGSMDKTTDGLNRINSSIQGAAEIIGVLGQRADDIGKIIEVIDDISEQTNLLALNAAIEAARAGEHGLGFAVVADEVRKLAEKSAQSTKEISELIQSIQKEARKAVENMDKSTGIVNEGLVLGGDLSAALRKISNVVTEVYKFAQEIGAATNEQSHGSSQIARATTRLNEITHEINSSVEEQASGTQAVVKAMERMRELVQQSTSSSTELAASSEQMSKMARSLLEVMDRFKLEPVEGEGGPRNGRAIAVSAGARY